MNHLYLLFSLIKKLVRKIKWSFHGVHVAPGSKVSLKTSIGRYSRINSPSFIGPCVIGSFVACGGRLIVRSSNHHTCFANMQDWTQKKVLKSSLLVTGKSKGTVEIKSACWIGDSVIILPGGSVGYGAVIGAGSVVTKPIPNFAIAVGNPARVIKYRFSQECIEFLLRIQWWNWSLKKIRKNKQFFEIDLTKLTKIQLESLENSILE